MHMGGQKFDIAMCLLERGVGGASVAFFYVNELVSTCIKSPVNGRSICIPVSAYVLVCDEVPAAAGNVLG